MGAGKSRIGPYLAKLFACSFYDTDKVIQKNVGKKVDEIFEDSGEEEFRRLESETIKLLSDKKEKSVIALGGGALINPQNKSLVESHGLVIYIKVLPQVIFERVKNSTKRPLLNIERDENFEQNLIKKINEMMEERKEVYESAHITVNRNNLGPEQVAEKIYEEINKL